MWFLINFILLSQIFHSTLHPQCWIEQERDEKPFYIFWVKELLNNLFFIETILIQVLIDFLKFRLETCHPLEHAMKDGRCVCSQCIRDINYFKTRIYSTEFSSPELTNDPNFSFWKHLHSRHVSFAQLIPSFSPRKLDLV